MKKWDHLSAIGIQKKNPRNLLTRGLRYYWFSFCLFDIHTFKFTLGVDGGIMSVRTVLFELRNQS